MKSALTLVSIAKELQGKDARPFLLRLGRYFLVGAALDDVELARETGTAPVSDDPTTELPAEELVAHVVTKTGRNQEHPVLVGRASFNDVVLTDASVSRSHAALVVREGHYGVLDLGSKDGTRVNDASAPKEGASPLQLSAGDRIRFGDVAMNFVDGAGLRDLLAAIKERRG